MAEAIIGDLKIFYTDQGSGYPVVLTHGLGSDHTVWAYQTPEFSKRYRLITWDCRGHGRTEVTEHGYTMDQFVADLYGLLELLGIERAHIGGLSMGGWISWSFALAHPDMVSALVLSNAAGFKKGLTKDQAEQGRQMMLASADISESQGRGGVLLETTLGLMFSKGFLDRDTKTVEMVKERLCKDPGVGYARTIRGLFDDDSQDDLDEIEERLGTIEAPALVIAGDEDRLTPLVTQLALKEAISKAGIEILTSAGHVTNMEQSDEWNRLALNFLSSVDSGL